MFSRRSIAVASVAIFAASFSGVVAYDPTCNSNLVLYWGQNSYGAVNPNDPANWQKNIGFYCDDDTVDTIPIAFVDVFQGAGGLPEINLANTCNTDNGNEFFNGTELLDCSFLAADIQKCQAKGKTVTISIGGATGGGVPSAAFADTIWDTFLGGSSETRPFGDAILDGVDLDIEGGSTSYNDFVNQLRSHFDTADKKYYITGAPQCPFPDAFLGSTLNSVAFDAVYVQFYNNFCGLQAFPGAFDFGTWDNWAKTMAPNPDVKVFIGAPGSPLSAGSGYVPIGPLTTVIEDARQYDSFGGVMVWDLSSAYSSDRFDLAIKSALMNGGSCGQTNASPPSTTLTTTTSTSTTTSTTKSTTSTTTSTTTTSTTTPTAPADSQPTSNSTSPAAGSTRRSFRFARYDLE